jgi:hypothetical protein
LESVVDGVDDIMLVAQSLLEKAFSHMVVVVVVVVVVLDRSTWWYHPEALSD